jgi:quercetin dioxygenase-like cupin family protein
MYFSIPGPARITGLIGFACIRHDYRSLLTVGGPIESRGRLKYIDGCSDSVLIAPPLRGDPCVNFLYAPPGTLQTTHTHPSVRVGLIIKGEGWCHWGDGEVEELRAGSVFILPTGKSHHFETREGELHIVVYHPDSDFGPTHDNHPMVNRTEVGGTSVAGMTEYRTLEIV